MNFGAVFEQISNRNYEPSPEEQERMDMRCKFADLVFESASIEEIEKKGFTAEMVLEMIPYAIEFYEYFTGKASENIRSMAKEIASFKPVRRRRLF